VASSRAEADRRPPVDYSHDVLDGAQLRLELGQTDLFGEAVEEAAAYLSDALERFRITMSLLPAIAPEGRVLELGANPYFLTRLLRRRGLDVTCANWFGRESGFGSEGHQHVVESGVATTYTFDHFNIEADRFPYEDGTYDVVLLKPSTESSSLRTRASNRNRNSAMALARPQAIRLRVTKRAAPSRTTA